MGDGLNEMLMRVHFCRSVYVFQKWQTSVWGNRATRASLVITLCRCRVGLSSKDGLRVWPSSAVKASLTLARILFPQCPAIWRAKSCHFSVTTARWRTVCAMSCHLSRISYELITKCVTPNVTHVHLAISSWLVVTPWRTLLNISKFSPRHGTHYFIWAASPRIPTHTVMSSSLIGTPNCVPLRKPFVVFQCEACFYTSFFVRDASLVTLDAWQLDWPELIETCAACVAACVSCFVLFMP